MKNKGKYLLIVCVMLGLPAAILFLPSLPWSARCRYVARRVASRVGAKVAVWRGTRLQPVTLTGRLMGSGALAESLKGAQVVAIESASGYGAMSDGEGRFTL